MSNRRTTIVFEPFNFSSSNYKYLPGNKLTTTETYYITCINAMNMMGLKKTIKNSCIYKNCEEYHDKFMQKPAGLIEI